MHALIPQMLQAGTTLALYLTAGGALALRPYFSEAKRWREHRRQAELEKASLEASMADLHLKVLQAQVEPHFLFNTLASVRSLVGSDPQRAAETIDALAEHLRATLPRFRAHTGVAAATLADQFAICDSYLKLMQIRMGARLSFSTDLAADLRHVPFPPLLLISLVENAIKHGVEPKAGAVHVTLDAAVVETAERKWLEIRVMDDGVGLSLGMGEGTGLANIRAQLLNRFGAHASLRLSARSSGGVVALLRIPLEPRPR
jgi:sensor histidine kinase YesM